MGVGLSSGDWSNLAQEYVAQKTRGNYYAQSNVNSPVVKGQISQLCTDGNDDGQIGAGQKAKYFVKGIGSALGSMVGNVIKHPIKTAAMIGACFIPVVGPAIAIGLGAYGAYSGIKTIVTAGAIANNAKTDAEAKYAWQNIGGGTFTTAASVLMMKGGAKMLKSQLTNPGATVANFKTNLESVKSGNMTKTQFLTETLKDGFAETKGNITEFGKGIAKNTKNLYEENIKGVSPFKAMSNLAKLGWEKITGKFKQFKKARSSKLESYEEKAWEKIEDARIRMENGEHVEFQMEKGLPKKITYEDGSYVTFRSNGKMIESYTVQQLGNGQTKVTVTKGNGVTTETIGTNYNNGKFGEIISENYYNPNTGVNTSSQYVDGKLTTKSSSNTNTGSSYTRTYGENPETTYSNGTTTRMAGQTKVTGADGKVTTQTTGSITRNGKTYTLNDKGQYAYQTTNASGEAVTEVLSRAELASTNPFITKLASGKAGGALEHYVIDAGSLSTNRALMFWGEKANEK